MNGNPRQETGGIRQPQGWVPPSPDRATSLAAVGLLDGPRAAARNADMRASGDSTPSPPIIERELGGRQWRVAPAHADLLDAQGFDWFNLRENPAATLVKRNSQRDVWRVRYGTAEYFAKFYHPHGWLARIKLALRGPTALREWQVGLYAAVHNVATVVPAAVAWSVKNGGASLLITEAVTDAQPLNDYWLSLGNDRHRGELLADSLARLIARAHQCGFEHGDMHPGNVLVRQVGQRSEAFFVDLHSVRIGHAVSRHQMVANLAQLNQWFRSHASRSQRRRFLERYIMYRDQYAQASSFARNWRIEPPTLVKHLHEQAERHANKLWAKRDRRSMRNTRYYARIKTPTGWRGHVLLASKHPAGTASAARQSFSIDQWQQWLRDPMEYVRADRNEILKDSHTSTVCKVMLPTKPQPVAALAKRPLARNPLKRLAQMFGRSRNWRAWTIANMMHNRDLPVAQPLAIVERYAAGFILRDSLILTDFVSPGCDLETFLTRDVAALEPARQRAVKDRLIESVVGLLKTFHDRGFAHRDMKAPNLMVTWPAPHEGRPRLTFIDMDGIRYVRRASERHRLRAIVRLCASLLGSPACTSSDRLRFLQRYLMGPGRSTAQWKQYWRAIYREVCSKLDEKEARRLWKLAHYGRE